MYKPQSNLPLWSPLLSSLLLNRKIGNRFIKKKHLLVSECYCTIVIVLFIYVSYINKICLYQTSKGGHLFRHENLGLVIVQAEKEIRSARTNHSNNPIEVIAA